MAVDVNEKINEELQSLEENQEIYDLESFILEGVSTEIPIIIDYPLPDGTTKPLGAKIRPLTSSEWNNCVREAIKFEKSFQELIVERGLLTKNGKPFPVKLVGQMASGAVDSIFAKISEVSGVKQNKEEQLQMAKDMVGF